MQELLKIRYPIIQAPMAGTDTPEFVAAACNAGVLGSLGAQYRTPEEITKAIAAIRRLTNKPFAVNLFALSNIATPSDDQITGARECLQQYYTQFEVAAPSIDSVKKVFSGGAARGIQNDYIATNNETPLLPFPYQNSLTRPFRKLANETGQIEYTNLWCGQGGQLARELTISELVETLMSETEHVLNKITVHKTYSPGSAFY